MVETKEIVDNIDAILEVPGLGGLLIGPADLSLALGVGNPGPNVNAPEVIEAIEKVGAACRRHNALCGIYMRSDIKERQEQGFMLFPSIAY
jgi:4-hydroxy-2-oxoheptanedioate aldolase